MDSGAVETGVSIAQVLLVLLFGGGAAGGGLLAWRAKRRADKAKLAKNTVTVTEEHRRDLHKELRMTSDYAHLLRGQVMDLDGIPYPWPDSIRHLI